MRYDYNDDHLQFGLYLAALPAERLRKLTYLAARWRDVAPALSDHLVLSLQAELTRPASREPMPFTLPGDWTTSDYSAGCALLWLCQRVLGPAAYLQALGCALAELVAARQGIEDESEGEGA